MEVGVVAEPEDTKDYLKDVKSPWKLRRDGALLPYDFNVLGPLWSAESACQSVSAVAERQHHRSRPRPNESRGGQHHVHSVQCMRCPTAFVYNGDGWELKPVATAQFVVAPGPWAFFFL